MSDKDRLRRLDALFAERVMGHTIQPAHRSMTSYDGGPPVVVGESATGDYGCYYGSIPRYTQSLDAVWEATHEKFCCRTLFSDYNYFHRVKVCLEDGTLDHQDITAEADHPAEALVLACLRAVGCSEEEMK